MPVDGRQNQPDRQFASIRAIRRQKRPTPVCPLFPRPSVSSVDKDQLPIFRVLRVFRGRKLRDAMKKTKLALAKVPVLRNPLPSFPYYSAFCPFMSTELMTELLEA